MVRFKNKEVDLRGVNELVYLAKNLLKLLYVVMIVAVIFLATVLMKQWGVMRFFSTLLGVISPLFIGFIIAWLLNPIVEKLESKKIPRIAGSLIVYCIFLVVMIVFLRVLVPTIYIQLNELLGNLPGIFDEINSAADKFFDSLTVNKGIDLTGVKENLFTTMGDYINSFTTNFPKLIITLVTSFFSKVVTIAFGLIIGLYMLFDFDDIGKFVVNIFPEKKRNEVKGLLTEISEEVRKCVNGTLTVASMVFVCDSIGFALIGLQSPLLFGVLCGLTDLIPYIGPYIGGIAAVIIGFSQSTFIGVITIVIVVVVQTIENFILQPLIMSKTMKLHPVTIIIGLLIFEHFFGILGMILATPCIALLKVITNYVVKKFDLIDIDEVVED